MCICQSQSPNSSHPSPTMSTPLFSICICIPALQKGHLYHFYRFHIYALIYNICFSLSHLLQHFSISLSDSSQLVYRNWQIYVYQFLCPTALLISYMSSNSLWGSLGFSVYSIMSSAISDSFTSSFPIWRSFISFYYLIFCG